MLCSLSPHPNHPQHQPPASRRILPECEHRRHRRRAKVPTVPVTLTSICRQLDTISSNCRALSLNGARSVAVKPECHSKLRLGIVFQVCALLYPLFTAAV